MRTTSLRVTGIDHIVLHVKDVERSKQFYMDVLGFDLDHETDHGRKMCFLRCASQGLDLMELTTGEVHGGEEMNHMGLRLADGERDEIVAELEKVGVQVSGRANDPNTMYFHDPDGHRIQVLSISEQQAASGLESAQASL